MAFVSDKYKAVFVHIAKNGGTSVVEALTQAHGEQLRKPQEHYRQNGIGNDIPEKFRPNGINVHDSLMEIDAKYPQAMHYTAFAVVRNPWDRIYSFYRHKIRRKDRDLPRHGDETFMDINSVFRLSNVLLLQPQLWWLDTEFRHKAPVHFIRFDQIREGLANVTNELGMPPLKLKHLNRSGDAPPYNEVMDDRTRRTIQHFYRHEIEYFDFEF